jgi:hypothetical protein
MGGEEVPYLYQFDFHVYSLAKPLPHIHVLRGIRPSLAKKKGLHEAGPILHHI